MKEALYYLAKMDELFPGIFEGTRVESELRTYRKEATNMDIREDFERVLTDCETRHAINSPVKGKDWRELTMDDYWNRLGRVDAGLLRADTLAETYSAALDCMLVLLMLSKKMREDLSWESRLGIMVIQQPRDPEIATKECEETP